MKAKRVPHRSLLRLAIGFAIAASLVSRPTQIAIAEERPTTRDIAGWSKARWGMTDDEILQAFPGEATRLEKTQQYGAGRVADVGIEDTEIDTYHFTVDFLLDGNTHKLVEVLLRLKEKNPGIAANAFDALEKALTEKYGKPAYRKERAKPGLSGLETENWASWHFPSTMIDLRFTHMPGVLSMMAVKYESAALKENLDEKL